MFVSSVSPFTAEDGSCKSAQGCVGQAGDGGSKEGKNANVRVPFSLSINFTLLMFCSCSVSACFYSGVAAGK